MKKTVFITLKALSITFILFLITPAGAGAATSCTFTKSLYLGVSDPQVKCLQQYLNSAGYTVSVSGAGSLGKESAYFGAKIKAAVIKWQKANGVSPASGYFGAISRTKYLALKNAAASAATINKTTPTPTPTTSTTPTSPTTTVPTTVVATTTAPLSITTTSIPSATAGAAYSTTISAVGGTGSYSWQVSNGSFPPGLNLVPASCVSSPCQAAANIFGTPVNAWTYTFAIMVTSGTQSASQQFTIVINQSVVSLKISPTAPTSLNIGQTFETQALYTPGPNCYPTNPCAVPDTGAVRATWTSSNTAIATVAYKYYDPTTAVITGVSPGTVTISANYAVGSINLTATIPVFVAGTVGSTLKITPASPTVSAGSTIMLQANYTPTYSCSSASSCSASSSVIQAVWTSSNNSVATVVYKSDDPKTAIVTGISAGVSTITAMVSYTPATGATLTTSTSLIVTAAQ